MRDVQNLVLEGEGRDGVFWHRDPLIVLLECKPEIYLIVLLVHRDDNDGAVGVLEPGDLDAVPVGHRCNADGARLDVAREMANVVEDRQEEHLVAACVSEDRRGDQVVHVVGPALLIQEQVPVNPCFKPAVEVSDECLTIPLGMPPITDAWAELLTSLCHPDMLLWSEFVHPQEVVIHDHTLFCWPGLVLRVPVPVVAHAPDILCGLRVIIDGLCP
mmetsp:Transcript_66028/g.196458  ORF Transcript_66028/g.196458 Transcript_66028/m.196458 type:complete len:216 (-) Transcript_66028:1169-1816(-)